MRRSAVRLVTAMSLALGTVVVGAGPASAAAGGCTIEAGCPGAVHRSSGWGIGEHNGWTGDTPGRRNLGG